MAPGEADVFIGRAATDLDIVVSGDSDLFCYKNVKTMYIALEPDRSPRDGKHAPNTSKKYGPHANNVKDSSSISF
ncbi:hypothetical protein SeMB42_g04588 [Synchytrium endobioticum]|uniref:XPG-I domain-containing protein n=1 Tax=Synchytrium endobioticum TaxID=286115 RepID=A0A507CY09_9FUNG|nr:hypothetical protein SeMB42_g04588 [Synchytrium endobioticum]